MGGNILDGGPLNLKRVGVVNHSTLLRLNDLESCSRVSIWGKSNNGTELSLPETESARGRTDKASDRRMMAESDDNECIRKRKTSGRKRRSG
jgi:hypothetical protein